ncbi:23S rRNA (adenine(2030)-N(6))-methyltransferase RlmJ [Aliiglaciecola litoralis]|uniref:Ribosomal RNA large subunit methyltransferase J n=1 Tax=Aliiglaciecola litoralis TaxID=582857 RepID=A0ABN1LBR9_9ALTE
MLSYRHGFHAGNHADVLKHIVQMLVTEKLLQKSKPFIYIDTHAGAGLYSLNGEEALKTREFETGISKITHQQQNSVLDDYVNLTQEYMANQQYPGSPLIAASLLRTQDKIVLMEYHNNEVVNLRNNLRGLSFDAKAAIHHRDGFEGLLALLPPNPARGMVLIDPPYEVHTEYDQVLSTVKQALKKWSTGVYIIWYPLLSARAGKKSGMSESLCVQLAQLNCKNLLDVRMQIAANTEDAGMYGSGLAILNAPWQLDDAISQMLPEINKLLSNDDFQATSDCTWRKSE